MLHAVGRPEGILRAPVQPHGRPPAPIKVESDDAREGHPLRLQERIPVVAVPDKPALPPVTDQGDADQVIRVAKVMVAIRWLDITPRIGIEQVHGPGQAICSGREIDRHAGLNLAEYRLNRLRVVCLPVADGAVILDADPVRSWLPVQDRKRRAWSSARDLIRHDQDQR